MYLFSLLISTLLFAGPWSVQFGLGTSAQELDTPRTSKSYDLGILVHSFVGYRKERIQYLLNSYAHFSKYHQIGIEVQDSLVNADNSLRSISFGAGIRYFIPKHFLTGGLLVGLQTFRPRNVSIQGGSYENRDKITNEVKGYFLGFGGPIGKSAHYEVSYRFLSGNFLTIGRGSSSTIDVIHKEKVSYHIKERSLSFILTFQIF